MESTRECVTGHLWAEMDGKGSENRPGGWVNRRIAWLLYGMSRFVLLLRQEGAKRWNLGWIFPYKRMLSVRKLHGLTIFLAAPTVVAATLPSPTPASQPPAERPVARAGDVPPTSRIPSMRRVLLAATFVVAVGATASAQRLGPPEPRPRLVAGADTNDAMAYYNYGISRFGDDPRAAAAAFYWAARLNPGWGEPLYARRAALITSDRVRLRNVIRDNRRFMQSDEMRRIDSLQFRALMLSPFLYRKLDRAMLVTYIKTEVSGNPREASAELDYEIDNYLHDAGPETRGWLAYSDGNLPLALEYYASALGSSRNKAAVRLDRARIFSMQNQVDSATAEFKRALEELQKKDEKDLVIFYNSKALAEYSIGVLMEGADNPTAAREAYGRALQEDLSYYPAHLKLGLLALGANDTTTAMSEMALAAQLAPDEPNIRYMNGYVLAASRHLDEAAVELSKAIELEPYYALPYVLMGQLEEMRQHGKEAAAAYQNFLDHASANNSQRELASARLSEIKEFLATAAAGKYSTP
jgi:tetratricopeptide (TPR) repeat protein